MYCRRKGVFHDQMSAFPKLGEHRILVAGMLKVTGLLSRNLWWMIEESWNQNSRLEYEKTHKSTSSLYLECSVRQRELDAWPRGWVNILGVW